MEFDPTQHIRPAPAPSHQNGSTAKDPGSLLYWFLFSGAQARAQQIEKLKREA